MSAHQATAGPLAVPVLMYHEVAGRAGTRSRLAVPPAAFAAQLAHLAEAAFTTLTFAALGDALAGAGQLPPRPVVLTFDDGFADFHETALPLLQRHGFTATVFVTTGWMQDAAPGAPNRPGRMLTRRQVSAAAAAGVEIGAHSHSHPQLDQLPAGPLAEELRTSKARLEDILGGPVATLAYPFGYSSERVRRAVREAGYRYACAVGNAMARPGRDLLTVPRLTIRRSTGLRTFGRVIRGQRVPAIYARDRALTEGWAVVRRTRAALRRVPGGGPAPVPGAPGSGGGPAGPG